jgi:hypothetical protein
VKFPSGHRIERLIRLLPLLLCGIGLAPAACGQGASEFQIVALNRLMQVMSDALLPLNFDVPTGDPQQQLQAQLVDMWYCGGNPDGSASLVAVVFPIAQSISQRQTTSKDCSDGTLTSLAARISALQGRPDWFAVSFITVRSSSGSLALAFKQPVLNVKSGAVAPSAVISFLKGSNVGFKRLDTTNLQLAAQNQTIRFKLDFLFLQNSAVIFASESAAPGPSLVMPSDVSLTGLLPTMNTILRLPHIQTRALLSGPFKSLTFPITAGGQTFTVSGVQINGSTNQYQTMGIVSSNGVPFHLTVNWAGPDLSFQNVRLAEAQVNCNQFDIACKARKAAAVALQNVLTGMVPPNTPMRPNSAAQSALFQAGGKKYRLRLAVERSSSSSDSLLLYSSFVLEPQ